MLFHTGTLARGSFLRDVCNAILFTVATVVDPIGTLADPAVHRFPKRTGNISIMSVQQMSVAMDTPAEMLPTDPTVDAARYTRCGEPALILISHEHGEHATPLRFRNLSGRTPDGSSHAMSWTIFPRVCNATP